MPDENNTQYKLTRVRPPRVKITYDVEIGDAIEKKQLPLIAGILADLGGTKPVNAKLPLKTRKFVEIDRDNFDGVMKSITPGLEFTVANLLTTGDAEKDDTLPVTLKFEKMEDFDPVAVLKQVPALKELFEARQRLSDLSTKLDGNDVLDEQLRTATRADLEKIKALPAPADDVTPAS